MDISIGLPAAIPGVCAALILDWARQADQGPFASLGVIDRTVYTNFEPLMTLAAVAGVTRRIGLMTTVLLAPARQAGILAKQAATLDVLSSGRLTLGLGVGGRSDDFQVAPASFHERGRHFDEQLAIMRRIWSGQPFSELIGAVGPAPVQTGGPRLLIGGYADSALERVGRWADGFIAGPDDAESARQQFDRALESWQTQGRAGRPRFVAASYFGLGPDAGERIKPFVLNYYSYFGSRAELLPSLIPTSCEMVQERIKSFAAVGADELVLWPCIPELDQVSRLADLAA